MKEPLFNEIERKNIKKCVLKYGALMTRRAVAQKIFDKLDFIAHSTESEKIESARQEAWFVVRNNMPTPLEITAFELGDL